MGRGGEGERAREPEPEPETGSLKNQNLAAIRRTWAIGIINYT
ncbi:MULTISPECIES: hypothetical protein [unclassified Microcoleus]